MLSAARWVTDQLGHSDPALTLRVYAHAMPEEHRPPLSNRLGGTEFRSRSEGYRCAAPSSDCKICSRTASLVCKERTNESAQHLTHEPSVPGTAVAKWIRKRKHPLAHRYFGQNMVDKMSGRIRHAPPTARRTKPPAFTREGYEAIATTTIAVYAQESVGEHAAL